MKSTNCLADATSRDTAAETPPDTPSSQTSPPSTTMVAVRSLRRTYQVGGSDVLALRGIDLDVAQGQFLGIVGVSGSGKSTLLHSIGGLDSPDEGDVIVDGHSLCGMSKKEMVLYRRKKIGFVFQSFYLVPNLTAIENVRLALTLQGIYGSERSVLADQAIDRVGMTHRKDHKPGQLSGGEQQRVTVARAIVSEPRLLLADEPTGNLDRATARSLMNLINEIRKQDGTTIVMVTHDESLAETYCDRIIRMQDGQFVN